MPAVFIQTRNGTVSIIRDLTKDEAENVVDTALDGPRLREEAKRAEIAEVDRARVANIFFSGNPNVRQIIFADVGEVRYRDGNFVWFGVSTVPASWTPCQDSDVIRAEVI